jgi:hypothetical protein
MPDRKLIPLTVYLTEDELQMLIEQTRRDNEIARVYAPDVVVPPDAVAAAALVMWLRGRRDNERLAAKGGA